MYQKINWVKIAFINLSIVALVGFLMRYKIEYNLPVFDQKHLLHAHSHFAFSGWLTTIFYFLYVYILGKNNSIALKKYHILIILNLLFSYGMLFAFTWAGYNLISIAMSVGTILVSFCFLIFFIKDYQKMKESNSKKWMVTALIWNALSSIGAFSLAYQAAAHVVDHKLYLASLYFFLHFQYNGWFLFATLGIVAYELYEKTKIVFPRKAFLVMTICTLINYLLNILWIDLPVSLYIIVSISAVTQLIIWVLILKHIMKFGKLYDYNNHRFLKILFILPILAFSLKLLLQVVSLYPHLSDYVFGFRTIVIAYLHLVFLGVYTIFIIAYCYYKKFLENYPPIRIGIIIFIIGILFNEFVLMIQGISSLAYFPLPHINKYLLVVAGILLTGSLWMALSKIRSNIKVQNQESVE